MIRFKTFSISKSWTGFAVEIAVVVIGILLALGAQQLVENFNDRERVDKALQAITVEIDTLNFNAREIQITKPCVVAQLDRIQRQLLSDDRRLLVRYTEAGAGVGDFVVRAPGRLWPSDAWESTRDLDVLRRSKPELFRYLTILYPEVLEQRQGNDRVRTGLLQLKAASVLAPDSPSDRFRLITTIEEIRGELDLLDLRAGQMRDLFAGLSMLPKDDQDKEVFSTSGTVKFCREQNLPLGKVRPASAQ